MSLKVVIGGYDAHGSSTAATIARALNIPVEDLIVKFPDTSPENLPKLLYALSLYNAEITIVDIAINVKDPNGFLKTLELTANNNNVTMIDHHESNTRFLPLIPKGVRFLQLMTAADMAKTIRDMYQVKENDYQLLLIGVIGDRDPNIRELISIESNEFQRLYSIANTYDVLIRQNVQTAVRGIYSEGVSYVERQMGSVQYPPAQIADQLMQNVKRFDNTIYVEFVPQQNTSMWIWKIFDELLRRTGADYLVSVSKVLDRQINQLVDVVFIVKYWLSQAPSPKPLLQNIIYNRRTIGHDDGFSITATSVEDARQLAQQIISALQSNFSSSVSLIPSQQVASALQSDFRKIMESQNQILSTLTEILQEMRDMYKKYLELKDEQVSMLRRMSSTEAHRAD